MMKFYLSSYGLGDEVDRLKGLFPKNNRRAAYISNALDFATDLEKRGETEESDIDSLLNLGLEVEKVDLREYFDKQDELDKRFAEFGVFWVSGGNTFVLRQAMRLSGFDGIIKDVEKGKDILYGGYSAGICVLAPTLKGIDLFDDPNVKPYGIRSKVIWDGLGLIDYSIVPHYKSDNRGSDANRAVEHMIANKLLFKALRDGEVIIIE